MLPYEMQVSTKAKNKYRNIVIKFEDEFINFYTQKLFISKFKESSKNDIYYLELNLDVPLLEKLENLELTTEEIIFKKYNPISDYPSSSRDFSFLISKHSNYDLFISKICNIKD